jgi:hypothetical protein
MSTELRNAMLCGLAVVFAILLTNPICNSAFNDDWSYSFTVKKLLETGKLTYNGWASASIIAQAYWGLLWVKIFGYSYAVLRLSTLPLAAGAISLCYLLARKVGLIPQFAIFTALLVGLCPLYLPLANTFMTDAPGLFFIFLSMYLLARAIESPGTATAVAWLIAGLTVGAIGGTSRQIVWVAPLLFAPYGAWLRRDNAVFVFFSVLGSALVLGIAILTMHWFAKQPYSVPEISLSTQLHKAIQKKAHYLLNVLAIGLTILWMILPGLWRIYKNWNGNRALIAFILLLAVVFMVKTRPYYSVAPWMHNTISPRGVMGTINGAELAGERPVALPMFVRIICGIAVFGAACSLGADFLIWFSRPLKAIRRTIYFLFFPNRDRALLPGMILFAAAYLVLLLPRCASDMAYDRYVLPILPCAMFPLLLGYQKRGDRKVPIGSWVLLGIYAVFGIAITQDINALGNARALAADKLLTAGKPRAQIDAGFEFNAETQIETVGHINDRRIQIPPKTFKPSLSPTYIVQAQEKYRLEFQHSAITKPTSFGYVDYISFLYPFHRRIYIDQYTDPWWLDASRAATHPTDKWHQMVPMDSGDSADK